VADRLYALPRSWFDERSTGRVHSLIVYDTERVDRMLGQLLAQTAPGVVVGVALCVVAVILDPLLFAALVIVIPGMFFVHRIITKRLRAYMTAADDAFAGFSADTQEALAAIDAARSHGVSDWERRQRSRQIDRVSETSRPLLRMHAVNLAVQGSLAASSAIVVRMVGGVAVAVGSLSLGALLAYYAVVALLLRQIGPAVSGTPVILTGRAALARIDEFLATEVSEPYDGDLVLAFEGGLRLDSVSFAYGETSVLADVDFAVRRGEHVAIVGPNGAGKTTLLSLLLGIARPQAGRVLADGVAFDRLDIAALRRQIGVVPQEPVLLRATIAENIAWGRASPDSPAVRAAAFLATASDFIDRLPDAYDTMLGDDGTGLSGGERQRLAIARALVGDPVLLMLDEPTNHLDARSIEAVLERLATLPGRPGIVTVTHDAQIAGRADRIVTLRRDRVDLPVRAAVGERGRAPAPMFESDPGRTRSEGSAIPKARQIGDENA
jgi:ATP-binding cassette subfamily B protein